MTEERIREIAASKLHKLSVSDHAFECAIDAMIVAVNEAYDAAARIAMRNMLPKTSEEITNLKVK